MMNLAASNVAMRADSRDQHNGIRRPQDAHAMDDQAVLNGEARHRLGRDRFKRLLRHAGVVVQFHRRHGRAIVEVAHLADKDGQRSDVGAAGAQRLGVGKGEGGGLNPDKRHAGRLAPSASGVTRPMAHAKA
jgi:hypothetical protein